MTAAIEGGEWSAAHPSHTLPLERPSTHFTGGWVGSRAGLDRRNSSSPPGFDPQTVQPVAQSLHRLSYLAHTTTTTTTTTAAATTSSSSYSSSSSSYSYSCISEKLLASQKELYYVELLDDDDSHGGGGRGGAEWCC